MDNHGDMSGESAPEYDGHCAFAISLGKSDEQQSGAHKLVQNGRTFHFRNPVAKFLFKTLNRSEKADAHWERRA